jgi:hypothetical protein
MAAICVALSTSSVGYRDPCEQGPSHDPCEPDDLLQGQGYQGQGQPAAEDHDEHWCLDDEFEMGADPEHQCGREGDESNNCGDIHGVVLSLSC